MWTGHRGRALTRQWLLAAATLLFTIDALRNPARFYGSLLFAVLAAGFFVRGMRRRHP